MDFDYTPSQYTRHDYSSLAHIPGLGSLIASNSYRDKRIQRALLRGSKCKGSWDYSDLAVYRALYGPYNDLPKYINSERDLIKGIVQWRLKHNK